MTGAPARIAREREQVQPFGSDAQPDQPGQDRRGQENGLEKPDPRAQQMRDDQQAGDQGEVEEHVGTGSPGAGAGLAAVRGAYGTAVSRVARRA